MFYCDGDTDTEFTDQNRWGQAWTVASSKESPDQITTTFLTHENVHVQRTRLYDWTSFRPFPQRSDGICAFPIGQSRGHLYLPWIRSNEHENTRDTHQWDEIARRTEKESGARIESWVSLIQNVWLNYSTQRSIVDSIRSACRGHKWSWRHRGRIFNDTSRLWPDTRTEPPTEGSL